MALAAFVGVTAVFAVRTPFFRVEAEAVEVATGGASRGLRVFGVGLSKRWRVRYRKLRSVLGVDQGCWPWRRQL